MIKLLIVDDHHLFREGLARILREAAGIELVGAASSGEEALQLARSHHPDLVLMDVNMPGIGGLEATRRLRAAHPHLRVLMLTISEQEDDLFVAVRAGARGYLLKNSSSRELIEAIRRVHAGEAVIAPAMAVKLLDEFAATPPLPGMPEQETALNEALSERELEVLRLVARGLSNNEIGEALSISPHTVKAHLRSILDKLHLRGRVEAAAWAIRHGLLRQR
jgi:two-component system NarL family response regulator